MKRFQTTAVFITMMALSFFFAGCDNSGSDHGLKNQPPVATSASLTTSQDTPVTFTFQASDPNGDALTYTITRSPRHGTLSGTLPQQTYTPTSGFSGEDTLSFRASDGQAQSQEATITIRVRAKSDTDTNTTTGGDTPLLRTLTLTIPKTTLNRDTNTTIELTATYDDNTTKDVTDQAEWIIDHPDAITIKSYTLIAKKDTNLTIQAKVGNTLSNKVNLSIYWEINGYRLPPEPDPKVNNATLLGVDVNNNGIRDDVERWIIIHYAKDPKYPKTKTAIALQYAWASQKILENPTMESSKYEDDALSCESYWADLKTKNLSGFEYVQFRVNNKIFAAPELKDKIYNTKSRIEQYFKFNASLSGHIFNGREKSLKNCRINIDILGE